MHNRIKERMKELGMKQTTLSERLGMTTVGLNQLVNSTVLKFDTFEKIAKAMDIPMWMICLSDEELAEIRSMSPDINPHAFHCPVCGASLKVVPDVEE